MKTIRSRFRITDITFHANGGDQTLSLTPLGDNAPLTVDEIAGNPRTQFDLRIGNPAARTLLKEGQDIWLAITPVDTTAAPAPAARAQRAVPARPIPVPEQPKPTPVSEDSKAPAAPAPAPEPKANQITI